MKDENRTGRHNALSADFGTSARRILNVDVAKYQEYLDGSGLRPEQKEEFLRGLWSIIMNFVDLGFEVHPLQEACGKLDECERPDACEAFDLVRSEHSEKPHRTTCPHQPGRKGGT
ncbi:hypothetical protein ACFMBG_14810 [Leisingera sp. D0M16]|uniref:hypothetical protein n=1 Tax=Leisingera coralii TaxID=3351347 RepID=UPI003B762582